MNECSDGGEGEFPLNRVGRGLLSPEPHGLIKCRILDWFYKSLISSFGEPRVLDCARGTCCDIPAPLPRTQRANNAATVHKQEVPFTRSKLEAKGLARIRL